MEKPRSHHAFRPGGFTPEAVSSANKNRSMTRPFVKDFFTFNVRQAALARKTGLKVGP
jgi:hypothetical protein